MQSHTRAKPETLLRRLAQTAKHDTVRLRAIELLLYLEGKLTLAQATRPSGDKEIDSLHTLLSPQAIEPKTIVGESENSQSRGTELLKLAEQ
jgi:hypothetical protein